jgi:hypothetical protein
VMVPRSLCATRTTAVRKLQIRKNTERIRHIPFLKFP